jgi:hypothetical protein
MTAVFSFFGTSISIISGDTMAGEMNLKTLRRFQDNQKVEKSYRKNMNAPMAAYFDSGNTPDLHRD